MGVMVVTVFFEHEKSNINAAAKAKTDLFISAKYNYSKFLSKVESNFLKNINNINIPHKDNELKFIVTIY